ncbi:hypothetical protein ABZU52_27300, partial [Micromonospora sp. NPDC005220]
QGGQHRHLGHRRQRPDHHARQRPRDEQSQQRSHVGVGRNERVRELARRIEQSRTAEVELLRGTP